MDSLRIWDHFQPPSDGARDAGHRRRYAFAKCKYCEKKVRPARTENYMPEHLQSCPKYDGRFARDRKVVLVNSIAEIGDHSSILERQVKESQQQRRDKAFLRAVISSDCPLKVVENCYWQKFVDTLVTGYKLPGEYKMKSSLLQTLHGEAVHSFQRIIADNIKERKYFTLVVDGWSTNKQDSIFGISLVRPGLPSPVVLDLKDGSERPHTAESLLDQLQSSLRQWEAERSFTAIVTDNPNNMEKLKRELVKWAKRLKQTEGNDQPHAEEEHAEAPEDDDEDDAASPVISLPCFAHSLNLLTKSFLSHSLCRDVIEKSSRLNTFFKASPELKRRLSAYAQDQGITRTLATYCTTRWYSVVESLRSTLEHQHPLKKLADSSVSRNRIASDVVNIIEDSRFWLDVETVLNATKPIAESLGRLERSRTNLADCAIEFLRIGARLERDRGKFANHENLLSHIRKSYNWRYRQFFTKYHTLAMCLHPVGKQALPRTQIVSAQYTFRNIMRRWGWDMDDAVAGNRQFTIYARDDNPKRFNPGALLTDVGEWWRTVPDRMEVPYLQSVAATLFSIVPTAVDIERLFSSLSLINTKKRSGMNPITLKMLGQVRVHLNKNDQSGEVTQSNSGEKTFDEDNEDVVEDSDDDLGTVGEAFADQVDENIDVNDMQGFGVEMPVVIDECAREEEGLQQRMTEAEKFDVFDDFNMSHPLISMSSDSDEVLAAQPWENIPATGRDSRRQPPKRWREDDERFEDF